MTWVDSVSSICTLTAQNPPIMNNAPWAKLTTPSVPKMSVSPRAISAYALPLSRPLSSWRKIASMG